MNMSESMLSDKHRVTVADFERHLCAGTGNICGQGADSRWDWERASYNIQ